MNPLAMMKFMKLKSTFDKNHPRFSSFLGNVVSGGIQEGSVIEITITKPDGALLTTNMKVMASDIELVNELKNIAGKQ